MSQFEQKNGPTTPPRDGRDAKASSALVDRHREILRARALQSELSQEVQESQDPRAVREATVRQVTQELIGVGAGFREPAVRNPVRQNAVAPHIDPTTQLPRNFEQEREALRGRPGGERNTNSPLGSDRTHDRGERRGEGIHPREVRNRIDPQVSNREDIAPRDAQLSQLQLRGGAAVQERSVSVSQTILSGTSASFAARGEGEVPSRGSLRDDSARELSNRERPLPGASSTGRPENASPTRASGEVTVGAPPQISAMATPLPLAHATTTLPRGASFGETHLLEPSAIEREARLRDIRHAENFWGDLAAREQIRLEVERRKRLLTQEVLDREAVKIDELRRERELRRDEELQKRSESLFRRTVRRFGNRGKPLREDAPQQISYERLRDVERRRRRRLNQIFYALFFTAIALLYLANG